MRSFNVALVVGGSIVIPHLRHAVDTLDLVRASDFISSCVYNASTIMKEAADAASRFYQFKFHKIN